MEANNQPLVSVPVITYNSAKYVLETLESIKAQTYQNIELIISDDCSTDNTVELCQQWVEQNKNRFVRTQIITSETNTGVSANGNRARKECKGEWVKSIAGDDLLCDDCIENYIEFVSNKEGIISVFGRIEAFGSTDERNSYFSNEVFDYSFFYLSKNEQLDYLINKRNCLPASTHFYNIKKMRDLNIENDERIPLLEDWPKWINILEKGVKLEFMDKVTVKYRVHEGALSSHAVSVNFYKSNFLFDLYYRYPRWKERGEEYANKRFMIDYMNYFADIYQELQSEKRQKEQLLNSFAYKIGKFILRPYAGIKKMFKR